MSWEDELSSARPTSSKAVTSHDPFDESSDFVAPHRSSSSSSRNVGRVNNENIFESDLLSSPLMKAPIYTSEALHASIRANRNLSASQKSLKDSLLAARKSNQDQKLHQQQMAVHPDEVDGDDQEAQDLVARLERKRNDNNSKDQGIQPIPALPSLTDLQKELLSVVSQAEPPPRTLQIVPLESRMSRWIEEGSELSIEEMDSRLRLLHSQYLDSRPHARADTRRMWNSQQRLHEMSVKLASIHSLSDMGTLENQLFAQESAHASDGDKSNADPTFIDPNSYFYDLYSLDRESYADLKHLHSSSIVDAVQVDATGGSSTGWWRTQLSELDEDWSERRKRDAEVFRKLEEEAVGYIDEGDESVDINDSMLGEHKRHSAYDRMHGSAPELNGGFLLGRRRAAEDAIAAGSSMEDDILASDRRAALAALDGSDGRNGGEAAVKRLTKDQLLARTQGRSFLSLSKGTDVILPAGQRLLRPGEKPQGESTEQSKVLDEIEEAFREDASVKKPQRKYGSHY